MATSLSIASDTEPCGLRVQAFGDLPLIKPPRFATLRRAIDPDVNLIDTADSYGPAVSEELIAEALYPYPPDLVIATKGGWERRPSPLRKGIAALVNAEPDMELVAEASNGQQAIEQCI